MVYASKVSENSTNVLTQAVGCMELLAEQMDPGSLRWGSRAQNLHNRRRAQQHRDP